MSLIDFSSLPNWLKLRTKHLVALALATGLLLFSPDAWLRSLGLVGVQTELKPWIGALFVFSSSLAALNLIEHIWKWRTERRQARDLREQRIDWLNDLTPGEKEVLERYINNQTRTQRLNIMDGDVQELRAKGVIRQASNVGTMYGGFAFNIRDWAWEYLHEHPEVLNPKLRGPLPENEG